MGKKILYQVIFDSITAGIIVEENKVIETAPALRKYKGLDFNSLRQRLNKAKFVFICYL